jgi:triacylglycerol esterase/lipase EstA (alpha/beta hydrolase family)
VTGALPPVRISHSAVYDANNNRLIVFAGGQLGCGTLCVLFNDVWVLSNANGTGGAPAWTQLAPIGTLPPGRAAHRAVYDATTNRMVIFGGGNDGTDDRNDTWVLTNANGLGDTPQWIQLSPTGSLPTAREDFMVGYDPVANAMTVFGGAFDGDLWILSNANGLGGTPAWQLITQSSPAPGTSANWNYGYDQATNTLIFFGGSPSFDTFRNDVWVLNNANGVGVPTWEQLIPNGAPGSPPATGTFLGTFDSNLNRLMIVPDATDLWILPIAGTGALPLYATPLFNDPNLVSYWPFEGNSKDWKGSNNGSDTSITYGTSYGRFGEGAYFDGSTSKINLPTPTLSGSAFTLSAWCNPLQITGNQFDGKIIDIKGSDGSRIAMGQYANPTISQGGVSNAFVGWVGTPSNPGPNAYANSSAVAPGQWYLVTTTYDGANLDLYVNGVLGASTPQTGTLNLNTYFEIGNEAGDFASTPRYFHGDLDDVAIFSRALSPVEISNLYTGNWVGTPPAVSVSPNSLSFPDTYLSTTSPAQYVTLTNTTAASVSLGTVFASPTFVVSSNGCGSSLAGHKTCRIYVRFRPTMAGPLNGTLTINITGPVPGQQNVNLFGTGIPPVLVNPAMLAFPDTPIRTTSAAQAVMLTNNTSEAISMGRVSVSSNFIVADDTCGSILTPGTTCEVSVQFRPTVVGTLTGTLTIGTSFGAQKVALSGNGVSGGIVFSATSLNFPDTNVGATSGSQSGTLKNETGAIVTMGSVVTSIGFSVSANTCGSSIANGATCRIAVKFQPASAGPLTGLLTVNEIDPTDSQSINLSGTGLNLVPIITRQYPMSGAAGAPGFVINIYGSNFVTSSGVQWNGMNRATTFVSSGHLQAAILASDIGAQNTAYATVANPAPGGGVSNELPFTIFGGGIACTSSVVLDPSPADCYTALVEDTVDDPEPLGTRIPLILIHGINGNTNPATGTDTIGWLNRDYWLAFLNYFNYPAFQQAYKIYRFHYVSNEFSTWELGRSLRNQIDVMTSQDSNWDIDTSTGNRKQIMVVAHSLGGLVSREYMNEHDTTAGAWAGERAGYRVKTLVTLATPHHGSPFANALVRTEGTPEGLLFAPLWNPWFVILDLGAWGPWTWQSVNERVPNRSDIRFDNFNQMWDEEYYISAEHNSLLDKISHTFDNKIYAYYGYIGASTDISQVGLLLPGSLTALLIERNPSPSNPSGNEDAALDVTGVLEQRIWDANFDTLSSAYPITSVDNDGVVHKDSAAFDGATLMGQVECPQYDHLQMTGEGALNSCDTGYPILPSLAGTLGVAPPTN